MARRRARSLNTSPNLTQTPISSTLDLPKIHDYTFGVDQELVRDLNLRFNFVRKIEKGAYGTVNKEYSLGDYASFNFIDPGYDGKTGTSIITAFNRIAATRPGQPLVTFDPGGQLTLKKAFRFVDKDDTGPSMDDLNTNKPKKK